MNQDNGKFTRENHSAEHGDSDAWCGRGIALYISGRYEEALQACDKALELNPYNSKAWSNKGKVLRCLGRSEDALQAFDKAIELDPNGSKTWDNKGAALGDLGRREEALQAYDKAVELDPDDYNITMPGTEKPWDFVI